MNESDDESSVDNDIENLLFPEEPNHVQSRSAPNII